MNTNDNKTKGKFVRHKNITQVTQQSFEGEGEAVRGEGGEMREGWKAGTPEGRD